MTIAGKTVFVTSVFHRCRAANPDMIRQHFGSVPIGG